MPKKELPPKVYIRTGPGQWQCFDLKKTRGAPSSLRSHFTTKTKERKANGQSVYSCTFCRSFTCLPKCEYKFDTDERFVNHLISVEKKLVARNVPKIISFKSVSPFNIVRLEQQSGQLPVYQINGRLERFEQVLSDERISDDMNEFGAFKMQFTESACTCSIKDLSARLGKNIPYVVQNYIPTDHTGIYRLYNTPQKKVTLAEFKTKVFQIAISFTFSVSHFLLLKLRASHFQS